ncbi:MAG: hypothetical protein ABJP08_08225 [Roseibium sp.]
MKRHNIIVCTSIAVFLPAAYHGMIVLSGIAVAAFFYEIGKMSDAIDRALRPQGENGVATDTQPVTSDDGS